MDLPALIVVLLVASRDLNDTSTSAMAQTAQTALEGRALVILRDAGGDSVSDRAAASLSGALRADAVVVLTWSLPDRRRAFVHLYRAADASWVDRALAFGPDDPPAERGRMIGFEVASMIPAIEAPAPVALPPALAAPRPAEPAPRPAAARDRPRPATLSADVMAMGALGLGGPAGGLGGEGSLRWWVFPTTALRAGAGLRVGDIPAASASTTVARLALGVASQIAERPGSHPLALGLRLDLLALRHSVTSTANVSGGARWVPGVDAAIEGSLALTSRLSVVAAVGAEVAFGTTRVLLDDKSVTSIPPFRLVSEAGLRIAF